MAYTVRFVDPAKNYRMIKDEIDAAYFEVMSKGDLIDRGQLKRFEQNLAAFVGVKYAVGLNSGYDALHMSLRAAGIGAGECRRHADGEGDGVWRIGADGCGAGAVQLRQ